MRCWAITSPWWHPQLPFCLTPNASTTGSASQSSPGWSRWQGQQGRGTPASSRTRRPARGRGVEGDTHSLPTYQGKAKGVGALLEMAWLVVWLWPCKRNRAGMCLAWVPALANWSAAHLEGVELPAPQHGGLECVGEESIHLGRGVVKERADEGPRHLPPARRCVQQGASSPDRPQGLLSSIAGKHTSRLAWLNEPGHARPLPLQRAHRHVLGSYAGKPVVALHSPTCPSARMRPCRSCKARLHASGNVMASMAAVPGGT